MKASLYDEINSKSVRKQYYEGRLNKFIRTYWYLDFGVGLLNEFKYLIGGIIALSVILKVENSLRWMTMMFFISLPVLTLMGYLWARYGIKVIEYLNLKLATHFGQYNIRVQEKQLQLLEELAVEIKRMNDHNENLLHRDK